MRAMLRERRAELEGKTGERDDDSSDLNTEDRLGEADTVAMMVERCLRNSLVRDSLFAPTSPV